MSPSAEVKTVQPRTPFVIWLITLGLIFSGLDLLFGISNDLPKLSASSDPLLDIMVLFIVLCFVSSLGIFMRKSWGYILAALVSLGFILGANGLNQWVPTLENPHNFVTFFVADTIVPVLVLVAIFDVLCFLNRKKGLEKKKYLSSAKSFSGYLTIAVLILMLVGLAIGASVPAASAKSVSVVSVEIVQNAYDPSNSLHFSPTTITVVIGFNNTVKWTNDDFTIHTVTSNTGVFNSGLLNNGNSWSYTFNTPGNYTYHCAIHPFMTGRVVVLS